MRDHFKTRVRQLGCEAQPVVANTCSWRTQDDFLIAQNRDEFTAQSPPVIGAVVVEGQAVVIGTAQCRRQCSTIEWQLRSTEIGVQDRPDRVVIVADLDRRQAGAQYIETVSDQGRHHHPGDCIALHDECQHGRAGGVMDGGVADCHRQRPLPQQVQAAACDDMQLQGFAIAAACKLSAGAQCKMDLVVVAIGKIAHEAFDATAPAVQDVQQNGTSIQPRKNQRQRRRITANEFTQHAQWRCRWRIATIVGHGGPVAFLTMTTHVQRAQALDLQTVVVVGEGGGACVDLAPRRSAPQRHMLRPA